MRTRILDSLYKPAGNEESVKLTSAQLEYIRKMVAHEKGRANARVSHSKRELSYSRSEDARIKLDMKMKQDSLDASKLEELLARL